MNASLSFPVLTPPLSSTYCFVFWGFFLVVFLFSVIIIIIFSTGSHDSFTFWVDVHAPVAPDQKTYVKYLATIFSVLAKKVMVKWSMTQVQMWGCREPDWKG